MGHTAISGLELLIMLKSGWKSIVLWIIVTILLGSVGSGLWEIALKPGGFWFWHSILTAATFGSKFLKDQVYIEAAKGNHEAIAGHSAWILSLFLGIVSGAATSYALINLKKMRTHENGESDWARILFTSKTFIRYFMLFVIFFVVYIMTTFFIQNLKVTTANELYTYFEQSLNICRPYISENQEQVLMSRYAALRTREEYIEITNDLKQIADSNHLNLPEFKPW